MDEKEMTPLRVCRERPAVQPVAERNGQLRGPLAFLPVSGDVDVASGLRRPPRVRGPRQETVTASVRPVLERNDNRGGGRRLRRQARPRLDDERPLRIAVAPEDEEQIVRRVGDFARDAMGAPEKAVTAAEKANIAIARRSIVAARHIVKGHTITVEDITTKRPGTGLSPMLWDEVIGSKASRDYNTNEFIELS